MLKNTQGNIYILCYLFYFKFLLVLANYFYIFNNNLLLFEPLRVLSINKNIFLILTNNDIE